MKITALRQLLDGCSKVRQKGTGKWMVCCPAHNDQHPSLSIREVDGGKILVYCFSGCSVAAITEAVGLRVNDLFADAEAAMHGRRRQKPPVEQTRLPARKVERPAPPPSQVPDRAPIGVIDCPRCSFAMLVYESPDGLYRPARCPGCGHEASIPRDRKLAGYNPGATGATTRPAVRTTFLDALTVRGYSASIAPDGGLLVTPDPDPDFLPKLRRHREAVLAELRAVAAAEAEFVADPRPDLAGDSAEWRRLLTLAGESMLAGALHGFRCCGARLAIPRGLSYDPELPDGWTDQDHYDQDYRTWIQPHAPELRRLLEVMA